MNDRGMSSEPMRRLQSALFYVLTAVFTGVVLASFFKSSLAHIAGVTGVIILLASIPVRAVVMAEQFRRAHLFRFALLSYLVIVLLLGAVAYKYLLS